MRTLRINPDSRFLPDRAGAAKLNISISTFRKLSEQADAVIFFGKARRTDYEKLLRFLGIEE